MSDTMTQLVHISADDVAYAIEGDEEFLACVLDRLGQGDPVPDGLAVAVAGYCTVSAARFIRTLAAALDAAEARP